MAPGPKTSSRLAGGSGQAGGAGSWRGSGTRAAGSGCGGRGQQGERGGPGPGDLDEGGRAPLDVARLPDLQAADQVGVGGPGALLAGGALIAPGPADELVRGLQHPPGARRGDQRLGVGDVQDEDAAVGGARDLVPLILVHPQALPGLRGDLHPDAQRPAPLVQVRQRHLPRDRGVVIGGQQHRPRLGIQAGGGVGGQLGQRHRLGLGDRRFAGAFQDAVPGVRVGEGAGAVQRRAEPAEQGGVAELDVGQLPGRAPDPVRLGGVAGRIPRGLQPAGGQPVQEPGRAQRRAARRQHRQHHDGLHDIGVVGGRAGPGVDHLVQQHGQVPRRQVPQGQPGLIGPDRDAAGARAVEQAAGAAGFDPGVPAALAVQHDQQRPVPFPGPGRGQGGGEPARPQPHHQVRLPAAGRADDDHVPGARGGRDGEHGVPAVADGADGAADRDPPAPAQQRDRAGRGGQAAGGADLPLPLPGVEGDRRGGHDAAQAGGDGVVPPRPRQRGQREPGRDRERGQQHERAGQVHGGQVGPAVLPLLHRGQRDRPPGIPPCRPDGEPRSRPGAAPRPRSGAAAPAASPAATPPRTRSPRPASPATRRPRARRAAATRPL